MPSLKPNAGQLEVGRRTQRTYERALRSFRAIGVPRIMGLCRTVFVCARHGNPPEGTTMILNIKHFALGRMTLGAIAMALLLTTADAQTHEPMSAMKGGMAASSAMASGGMDMKTMMKDMGGKMTAMPMSGNPDIDFAMMMRIHHQGAIDMAIAELSNGKDPQMRKMAKAIVTAQKKEITQFDAYLAKHGHAAHKMNK